jgi:glycosyltransferase involved in cell wall biosynthesis
MFQTLIKLIILLYFVNSQYAPLDKSLAEQFKSYIITSKQGKLLPDRNFTKSEKPKISVIIPMYNEEKNVISAIRSVQNQNLQDIEIVCVNDNSNDKTLSLLKKLQEEDPRITIIINESNRGILYNRVYGAIESKGEYVAFVDADDGLCNKEILEKAYDVATKKYNQKIDVVHYQTCGSIVNKNGDFGDFLLFNTFIPESFDKVIKQPEIADNYFQKSKNITGSGLVFDKIYRRQLIKKVGDYIGPNIWNQHLIFSDDFLLAYGVMRKAKSIVNIEDVGYWHLFETKANGKSNVWEIDGYHLLDPEKANKKIGDFIIITERLLELTEKEPESLELREFSLRKLEQNKYMKAVARSLYYDKYLSLCEKFIKWKYIDKPAKERTLEFMKYLLSFKVDPINIYGYIAEEEDEDDGNDDDDDEL